MKHDECHAMVEQLDDNARRSSSGKSIEAIVVGARIYGVWYIACQGKQARGGTLAKAIENLGEVQL